MGALSEASPYVEGGGGKMGAGWLVLHLVILTAGELYLSPVRAGSGVRGSSSHTHYVYMMSIMCVLQLWW